MQTWTINGQTYNHAQLMELKRKKLNPLTDEIVMSAVTNRKPVGNVVESTKIEEGQKEEKPENVPEVPAEIKQELSWPETRNLAKEKGMKISNTTKKAEIIAFLAQ